VITLKESAEAAAAAEEGVGGVGMAYDRRVLKVPCDYLERQRSENVEAAGADNAESAAVMLTL